MFPVNFILFPSISFLIGSVLSAITSSPGIKRVYEGGTVNFLWTYSEPVRPVSIQNITSENATSVRGEIDIKSSVATVIITNVGLWDAGNYSITVDDDTDTDATIFVYEKPTATNVVVADQEAFPLLEHSRLLIHCQGGDVRSRPTQYASKMLYTFERDGNRITDLTERHNVSENWLIIDPVLKKDEGHTYRCKAEEAGSNLISDFGSVFKLVFHEFTGHQQEVQKKVPGEECTMKWELSYSLYELLRDSAGVWNAESIKVTLHHSQYSTLFSVSLREAFNDGRSTYKVNFGSGKSAKKRASLSLENKIILFHLTDIEVQDAGEYRISIVNNRTSHQQSAVASLEVKDVVRSSGIIAAVVVPIVLFWTCFIVGIVKYTKNQRSSTAKWKPNMAYKQVGSEQSVELTNPVMERSMANETAVKTSSETVVGGSKGNVSVHEPEDVHDETSVIPISDGVKNKSDVFKEFTSKSEVDKMKADNSTAASSTHEDGDKCLTSTENENKDAVHKTPEATQYHQIVDSSK